MLFTIFLMESHSHMEALFGCSHVALYFTLSYNDLTEFKKILQTKKEKYRDIRKMICENMTQITTSPLLTTDEAQKITILFTEFLYEFHTFIQHLFGIGEIALNENLTNEEQEMLKNILIKAREKYREGRKITYEKLKIVESIVNVVT